MRGQFIPVHCRITCVKVHAEFSSMVLIGARKHGMIIFQEW